MASDEIRLVISTISDGRARDVRFRQNQFHSLHRWISSHTDQVEAAIRNDAGFSVSQAKYVVALALRDLRSNYEKLDLKQALRAEYSVKHGRDNENRSVPEDLVYIISETYMTFYSVMSALFACIAAGSCCLIELPNRSTQSEAIARLCLVESLDKSAFAIVSTRPSSTILARCLVIDQLGSLNAGIGKRVIRSRPQLWTAAIVDRGADLELAAKYIHASRTFGGSPYAPNCILVNEFVEEAFVHLLRKQGSKDDSASNNLEQFIILETNSFKISRLSNRADLKPHSSKPTSTMHLLPTASHEDAIDAIECHHEEPLLALYVFAAPAAAKYLTQFIRSNVSFVNSIPANLLVGPAAPMDYRFSQNSRYNESMMQIPSPSFVTLRKNEPDVQQLSSNSCKVTEAMYCRFMKPLPSTGQPRDGDSNFFAQGLVTGIVVFALPLTIGIVGAITYGALKAYRYLK